MNTALEYSTRVVQEGSRRCKKSTLNDLVHLTPLRIPLMNPPIGWPNRFLGVDSISALLYSWERGKGEYTVTKSKKIVLPKMVLVYFLKERKYEKIILAIFAISVEKCAVCKNCYEL
jgi:hypothetical protein